MTASGSAGRSAKNRRRSLHPTLVSSVQRTSRPIVIVAPTRLKRLIGRFHSTDDVLRLAYGGFCFRCINVWPWQEPSEIASLLLAR